MEMKRTGGANGNPLPTSMSTHLLLAVQGQSPRQTASTVYTFTQTCIRVSYISPYQQHHTLCRFNYAPVKPASVLKDFDILDLSPDFQKPMVAFLHAKAFTVSILDLLNQGKGQETDDSTYFKVSQEAGLVQRVTNIAASVYAKSETTKGTDDFKLKFCQFLSKTCCFTVMSYAAGFHHDKIGKNIFYFNQSTNVMRPCTKNLFEALLPGARECGVDEAELRNIFFSLSKITAFVENKMLLRMKNLSPLADNRGGCGRLQPVGAVLDHNNRAYGGAIGAWPNAEVRELIRVARGIQRTANSQRIIDAFAP
jgi:hypothetical protein